MSISKERAELIARAQACVGCREYSYRRVTVRPSSASMSEALNTKWTAKLVCGVCGLEQELGLDDDGDILYIG